MNLGKALRERIKRKYETDYLDEIEEINEKISIGGDGHARIRDINEDYMRYGCKKHFGISRYINSIEFISNEKKKMIHERIDNELCGITPEDRIFEKLPESMRLY